MRAALLVLAGFALVTALLGWTRWRAGRRWAAAGHLLLSIAAAASVTVGWPVVGQLATFERRVAGATVAELLVEQAGAGRYRLTLTRLPAGRMQVYEVEGQEWRLALCTLDWAGVALEFGPTPGQRLERLESRHSPAPGDPGNHAGSAYPLHDGRTRDPWPQAWQGPEWAQVIRLREHVSPWLPLAHGAMLAVRFEATGLEVTPRQPATADALAVR